MKLSPGSLLLVDGIWLQFNQQQIYIFTNLILSSFLLIDPRFKHVNQLMILDTNLHEFYKNATKLSSMYFGIQKMDS